MIFNLSKLQNNYFKSSKGILFAYLPVADSLFPLLLFFYPSLLQTFPKEVAIGEGYFYLGVLWKVI